MYKDLEKIPPIESLFHCNIEAGARPYWVQYMVPFKLLLLLFWQIKKPFTPIKYRAEKVLRHPMIDHLIIKKYEGWKFLLRYKSKKNNLVLLLCFSFTCIFLQNTEHGTHLWTSSVLKVAERVIRPTRQAIKDQISITWRALLATWKEMRYTMKKPQSWQALPSSWTVLDRWSGVPEIRRE